MLGERGNKINKNRDDASPCIAENRAVPPWLQPTLLVV